MIKSTPTQWITKKNGVPQMSTNDDQSSGGLSLDVFALFATTKTSRVLDEGLRLQLVAGIGGVFWLKLKHDK